MAARHIAFFGKSGVGISALVANLGVALVETGIRVLLVGSGIEGCATTLVHGGESAVTLLEQLGMGKPATPEKLVKTGHRGVHCVEIGSPLRGGDIITTGTADALCFLHELRLSELFCIDIVLYDVPGVFTRTGENLPSPEPSWWVYAVTSADFSAIAAANGIIRAFGGQDQAQIGGIIGNLISGPFGEAMVSDYARQTTTDVLALIPRSLVSIQSGLYGRTVLECAPFSNQAYVYRKLARRILEKKDPTPLLPLDDHVLRKWGQEWGELLLELESGIVRDGASI